jgi:hypothetical protein
LRACCWHTIGLTQACASARMQRRAAWQHAHACVLLSLVCARRLRRSSACVSALAELQRRLCSVGCLRKFVHARALRQRPPLVTLEAHEPTACACCCTRRCCACSHRRFAVWQDAGQPLCSLHGPGECCGCW